MGMTLDVGSVCKFKDLLGGERRVEGMRERDVETGEHIDEHCTIILAADFKEEGARLTTGCQSSLLSRFGTTVHRVGG